MAYNPAIADYVCEQLALGRSLLSISRDGPDKIDGMPSRTELCNWEKTEPHGVNSTQARTTGYHKMAEECVDIADDGKNDWIDALSSASLSGDPGTGTRRANSARSRLASSCTSPRARS